ncbi:hypothetical protein CDEN61S_01533 [Castellaniella denitrificans]
MLGRTLGEVIRDCEGRAVYDVIEKLRRAAVKFRREGQDRDGRMLERQYPPPGRRRGQFRGARLQLLPAPVQHRRGPRPDPPPAPALAGRRPRDARQPATCRRSAAGRRPVRRPHPPAPGLGLHRARADGAPHRSPAQEHAGPAPGHRPAPAPAGHAARAAGSRPAAGTPDRADRRPVADPHAAPEQAHRARRDRQRPVLLHQHLLQHPAPAPPGHGGAAAQAGAHRVRRGQHAAAALRPHGQLDRRRPRQQPERGRRHAGTGAAAPVRARAALLPDRGPRPGRRTVDLAIPDARHPRPGRTGRRQPGSVAPPPGRALPARLHPHLRPAGRHRAGPDRPAPGPAHHLRRPGLRHGRRTGRGPAHRGRIAGHAPRRPGRGCA